MRRLWIAVVFGAVLAQGAVGSAVVAAGQGQGGAARAARLPAIAERVAGFQKLDGFFPLYWDEPTGTLYFEIPKLDTEILYVSGIGAGMGSNDIGIDRAQLGAERHRQLPARGPEDPDGPAQLRLPRGQRQPRRAASAVEDAFAKSVIWGFTATAETDGRVLVDASDFLMRDSDNVAARLRPASYRFDRTRSAVYMGNTQGVSQEHRNRSDVDVRQRRIAGRRRRARADRRDASATSCRRPTR